MNCVPTSPFMKRPAQRALLHVDEAPRRPHPPRETMPPQEAPGHSVEDRLHPFDVGAVVLNQPSQRIVAALSIFVPKKRRVTPVYVSQSAWSPKAKPPLDGFLWPG